VREAHLGHRAAPIEPLVQQGRAFHVILHAPDQTCGTERSRGGGRVYQILVDAAGSLKVPGVPLTRGRFVMSGGWNGRADARIRPNTR